MCRRYIDRQFKDRPELRDARHAEVPVPGEAADLRHAPSIPRSKKENVTLGAEGGGVGDQLRDRRCRRCRTRGRRHRHGDRLPTRELPGPPRRRRARRARRCTSTGPTSRAPTSASRCAGFPNFFMLYGPGTNGGDIVSMLEAQAAYAVRAVKRMTTRAGDGRRGEAELRGALVPVAPVQDGRHLLDDDQQLLQVTDGQDRDTVAVRQRDVHACSRSCSDACPRPPPAARCNRGFEAP